MFGTGALSNNGSKSRRS